MEVRSPIPRRVLVLAAAAYLAFVVYGSLVPLEFHPRPLGEAWEMFRGMRYLELGIASRADWVANLLLMIPLAFLATGALGGAGGTMPRVARSLAVWLACLILSFGIEFTQVFFPPRTVSWNDVLAEGTGAALGTVLWWVLGPAVAGWLTALPAVRGRAGVARSALIVYLAGLFGYALLPLDLTLSPVEIYHKWRAGKIILAPFGFGFRSTVDALYGLGTDVALWIPVGFLWRLASRRSSTQIWAEAVLAAGVLEFAQLFVYSRVTDVTDLLTAAAGAGLGILVARRLAPGPVTGPMPGSRGSIFPVGPRTITLWTALAAAWLVILAAVFWYPYDFHLDPAHLRRGVESLRKVPFQAYYFGSEFRAVTEVLHKFLFFLPLGVLLAVPALRVSRGPRRRLYVLAVALAVAGAALGIEAGQALIPGKNPDLTDWILETAGGVAGALLTTFLAGRLDPGPDADGAGEEGETES